MAAPSETEGPWLVRRDRAATGRSDPAVPLKTSASLTEWLLEEVQSISGAGAEVGPLPFASYKVKLSHRKLALFKRLDVSSLFRVMMRECISVPFIISTFKRIKGTLRNKNQSQLT